MSSVALDLDERPVYKYKTIEAEKNEEKNEENEEKKKLITFRDSTPCQPKGPPFDTFSEIHFWPTDPKIFLKAPWAPIYTNFEGERAPKKTRFFVKIFQKVPKNGFFDCFFKNLTAAQKI